ncbi:MAG TPA: SAM-dependent methyltransferase [Polyangia bacterium]|nr:SAM-dependent methyltransferase [Polyangia bacterium]
MPVSRAGAKLDAALSQFELAGAVKGARAVDVGASAGGFTEVLLAHGAASVLAVDVGRDQLHPSLRSDARVTVLEETDWRHLSLNEAEGPFDFFTVDVSFVSARNMLRGLAFRLRPGAQGVVLVKPQFELPDRQVKGGEVRDQNLRQAAVDRVRKRGEALGFRLVADVDSPVAGREGSVEILAHLRFEGRSERLPAPGERRPHQPRARRSAAGPESLRWFAVVAPGLEPAAEREVRGLEGVHEVTAVAGGVEWTAPPLGGLEANLWLRTVTRVVARVGSVEAREFGKLRRRAAELPWDRFLARGATVSIRASATRSRLYHTGALAETAALAIADAVPGVRVAGKDEEQPAAAVLLRGEADRFTFSVDASGERLHRRGARIEVGAAPMRETLAAGLLALAGWDPSQPLCDPVCGAGTIAIEAALQAVDRAPGLDREFALEDWPLFAAFGELAAALRERARARVRPGAPAPIVASDRDPAVIESATRNAARAGVAEQIGFACRDLGDARPTSERPGLVIANPPYGRRLGDPRAAVRVYRDLGRLLRAHFRGWRAAVVVPARLPGAGDALRLTLPDHHRLRNGGLPIELRVGAIT